MQGFCGLPKLDGVSYCEHHVERCYTVRYTAKADPKMRGLIKHDRLSMADAAEFLQPA